MIFAGGGNILYAMRKHVLCGLTSVTSNGGLPEIEKHMTRHLTFEVGSGGLRKIRKNKLRC